MTGVRKVRMRTYLRTVRRVSRVLRRGARPRLSGGAHGAQTRRRVRTPSAHPLDHVLALVATYPGPHPTTDDPDTLAAHAEQVLAWLRHDHPTEWRDVLADVGRYLTSATVTAASSHEATGGGMHRGAPVRQGTEEVCPPPSVTSERIGPMDPRSPNDRP